MSTPSPSTRTSSHVQDLVFAEIALREKLIPAETIDKGWSVLEEMAEHGIGKSLPSILLNRRLIDKENERQVLRHIEKILVPCARCRRGVPIRGSKTDAMLRCERCQSVLDLVVADDEQACERPIEERLATTLLSTSPRPVPSLDGTRPGGQSVSAPEAARERDAAAKAPRQHARDLISRFDIETVLHCGPHGRLYKARPAGKSDAPHVALKVLSPEAVGDPHALDRLEKALSEWNPGRDRKTRVTHSLLAEGEVHYVVRPLLRKPFISLADLRVGDIRVREALLRRTATLVADLHAEGRTHGNLKPSNVIVRPEGRLEHAFLVDPAFPRLLPTDDELARWALLLREPRYRSPEEIAGKAASQAADVYNLGWTFYRVLSGEPPFADLSAPEILRRHVEGPCPGLPDEFRRWKGLIEQMTAVDPSERPRNGKEVLARVDAILSGKGYRAPSVTPRAMARTPTEVEEETEQRRFPLRFAVGPALLAVALGWVGWCFLGWRQAIDVQKSVGRYGALQERYAEKVFYETRAQASEHPENGRELWESFIVTFPDSALRATAEAERGRFETPEQFDVLELFSEIKEK